MRNLAVFRSGLAGLGLPVLIILAGLAILLLSGLAYVGMTGLSFSVVGSLPGTAYEVRPVEEMPAGVYCVDVNRDGVADAVILARGPVRVLRKDGGSIWPCKTHSPPVSVEARGWVIYIADGELVSLRAVREGGSP